MDRWKSRGGRSQRREEKRREEERRSKKRKSKKKEDAGARKGRKVARFNMHKTHHARSTFGNCDVEKVHAVVARSTFPSQNVQNTPASKHFWKLRCRKVHAVQVNMLKTHLQSICKDAFRMAGAVQETCSSEMLGGQGADFLR